MAEEEKNGQQAGGGEAPGGGQQAGGGEAPGGGQQAGGGETPGGGQQAGGGEAPGGEQPGGKGSRREERKKAKERSRAERLQDTVGLRRTAKEVKRHSMLTRAIALIIGLLVAIVAVTYVISYFYDKFGSFTVKVNKYDMAHQGLTLSDTPEYEHTVAELNANIIYDMTNISGQDLPLNLDKINGSHNGENYIAYTFYLINAGRDTISYEGELFIENVTKNVDDAVRVAIYEDGEKTIYGKTKSNGQGMESDCDKEFLSSTIIMRTQKEGFAPKDRTKYTIVIWLEGNDPDCVDAIIGGTIKFTMEFKIIEST